MGGGETPPGGYLWVGGVPANVLELPSKEFHSDGS